VKRIPLRRALGLGVAIATIPFGSAYVVGSASAANRPDSENSPDTTHHPGTRAGS
jgi:hypothetical protein